LSLPLSLSLSLTPFAINTRVSAQELKRSLLASDTATLEMGSLKTASSVLLVVRGGSEVRGGGMPSDSDME
jgi:hypothetical protein